MKEHLTKDETEKLFNLTHIKPHTQVNIGNDYAGMPIYEMRYSIPELISMLPLYINPNTYHDEYDKCDCPTHDNVMLGFEYCNRYNEWYTYYENIDCLLYEGSAPEFIDSIYLTIFDLTNKWNILNFHDE